MISLQNRISVPQNLGDFKDADTADKQKATNTSYDEVSSKRDKRMVNQLHWVSYINVILHYLSGLAVEPFTRLCQPTDRHPIILNDSENELEGKISDGISDSYTAEDASDCDYGVSNPIDKCGLPNMVLMKTEEIGLFVPKYESIL